MAAFSSVGVVKPTGPLVIGGALKIAYDVLLFRAFRHVCPPEEELAMAARRTASTRSERCDFTT
jgi:hypothetical protein